MARLHHAGRGIAAVALGITLLTACGKSSGRVANSGLPKTTDPSTSTSTTVEPTSTTEATTTSTSTTGGQVVARSASSPGRTSRTTTPAPGSTAAPSTTTAPAAPAPAYAAPARGTYKFDTTGNTSYPLGSKAYPAITTLAIDAPSGSRQHSLRQLKNGSDGFVIEQVLDYGGAGIAVAQQKVSASFSGMGTVKDLKPASPVVILPPGAKPGAHKEFDLAGDGISAHEVVDVLAGSAINVGGQTVNTLLVKSVITFAGSVTGTLTMQQWFAPSHRLPAKERLVGDVKIGMFNVHTAYDATLKNLSPV